VTQENTDIHSRHKPVTTGRIDARRARAAIAGLQMAGNKIACQQLTGRRSKWDISVLSAI